MSDFRPSRFQVLPMVIKNLLIINGLMFLATIVVQNTYHIDLTDYLGLRFFTSDFFRPHQLVSHMFMHGNFLHIFSNMFSLWMFGSVLENVWGPKRFLLFYMVCGIGGALTHQAVSGYEIYQAHQLANEFSASPDAANFYSIMQDFSKYFDQSFLDNANATLAGLQNEPHNALYISQAKEILSAIPSALADVPVIGASGAVFGVLLAFGMLFPNTYLYLMFPPIPIKAKYFVILYGAFELYAGFTGTESGVAHFAHLGGMLFGFILIKFWNRNNRRTFY